MIYIYKYIYQTYTIDLNLCGALKPTMHCSGNIPRRESPLRVVPSLTRLLAISHLDSTGRWPGCGLGIQNERKPSACLRGSAHETDPSLLFVLEPAPLIEPTRHCGLVGIRLPKQREQLVEGPKVASLRRTVRGRQHPLARHVLEEKTKKIGK